MKTNRIFLFVALIAVCSLSTLGRVSQTTKQGEIQKSKSPSTQIEKPSMTKSTTDSIPAQKESSSKNKPVHKKYTSKKIKHGKENVDQAKKAKEPIPLPEKHK